jgi:hypothetical protein
MLNCFQQTLGRFATGKSPQRGLAPDVVPNPVAGRQLVEWLNGLPEVQEVLKLRFGGRPISWQREADRLDEQAH